MNTRAPALDIENLKTATFECVFPVCGGICCKNGRPGVEPGEVKRLQRNLGRFLPHLRPEARKVVQTRGFLTNRRKGGRPMLAVSRSWCVFFNEGCVLHKVGAAEGNRWRYKPWHCVTFPLERTGSRHPAGKPAWYIRQWRFKGEGWDLFCLNPKESRKKAERTLAGEIAFAQDLESGKESWRGASR